MVFPLRLFFEVFLVNLFPLSLCDWYGDAQKLDHYIGVEVVDKLLIIIGVKLARHKLGPLHNFTMQFTVLNLLIDQKWFSDPVLKVLNPWFQAIKLLMWSYQQMARSLKCRIDSVGLLQLGHRLPTESWVQVKVLSTSGTWLQEPSFRICSVSKVCFRL